MKEQIKNLLKLLVIMYDQQTKYHDNTCYRNLEDMRIIESYNACLRKGCTHIDFCMQLNKIMNELNKEENKECEHNWIQDLREEQFTSTIKLNKMICTKCFATIYIA